MISDKYKFIFVHIRKTGGTSIEKIFVPTAGNGRDEVRYKHLSPCELRQKFPKEWGSYLKFSFVRNPYDLLVSRYNWSKDIQNLPWYKKRTFKEFVMSDNVKPEWSRVTCQYNFLDLENEDFDFIGRFENLQQDFNTVCDKIGIPHQELPHTNKSKHKHYAEYYDNETLEIVAKKYAKDMEYFDYKKPKLKIEKRIDPNFTTPYE